MTRRDLGARADLTVPAFAKINLDLRILGVRPDGFHDLKTIFQSLALHDELTFTRREGSVCASSATIPRFRPTRRNLVWKAASLLWRTAGQRRGETPRDVVVSLRKRIPAGAGLGGGSANAAIALLGLARVWELDVDVPTLSRLAASRRAPMCRSFWSAARRSGWAAATTSIRSPTCRAPTSSSCGPKFWRVDGRGVRLVRHASPAGRRASRSAARSPRSLARMGDEPAQRPRAPCGPASSRPLAGSSRPSWTPGRS